ncbi:MAG: S41 family peptidase [Flavobacteriales bacterium]|nr:S41 family peptidase [Flavobacteriales bacterium]MBP9078885.1 S41 family peptidase [Flavobacteriales bacterium]
MKHPFGSWKTTAAGLALITGGAFTLAAGDNYFEVGKNLEIFNELYKNINIYYVDEVNPGELIGTGIDAMLESLDPYTQYIPESDLESYRFMTTGQYGGIGAMIRKKGDGMMVSEPYEEYPAMKSGIRAGDRILEVDGRSTKDMDTDEVSKLLKGQAGTQVKVRISRNDQPAVDHLLTREEIKIPDVPYKALLDTVGGVGYIKLNSFTQTAGLEVRNAVKELKDQGARKMVLDLRGNGGGLLREAINIVNIWVPKGNTVVETRGKIDEWDKTYKTLSEPMDMEMPLVVLVDTGSASASEIVAGALQDLDRAVVVGQRTFGKGLVQQTRDLFYNSKLKVTVAKYYIPSGRCIQKVDYAHHDSTGSAVIKADSTIKAFKTANGRTVYDGRGIAPDVGVALPDLPKVVIGLYGDDIFFDFANEFQWSRPSIAPAGSFTITDDIFQQFLRFVEARKFTYTTSSLDDLDKLVADARKERYYDQAKGAIEALRTELNPDQSEVLNRFRPEIEEVLKSEIVGRYYFQTGRAKAMLGTDPVVLEAVRVLNGPAYKEVLAGTGKTN